jgi:glutathione S-transferase
MPTTLHLISHHLCPYVQRAVIVAAEKGLQLERTFIDLAAKPSWFLELSPTGKVPLLRITDTVGAEHVLFESAVICEYLDETSPPPLLPVDPLARAKARAWVEFASGTLADIAGFYSAPDAAGFDSKQDALRQRFAQVEAALVGPWFAGARFGLVDAAFGPVFRYLDAFEALAGGDLAPGLSRLASWRASLAERPSVTGAVAPDYDCRLAAFLRARNSHLSGLMAARVAGAEGALI